MASLTLTGTLPTLIRHIPRPNDVVIFELLRLRLRFGLEALVLALPLVQIIHGPDQGSIWCSLICLTP